MKERPKNRTRRLHSRIPTDPAEDVQIEVSFDMLEQLFSILVKSERSGVCSVVTVPFAASYRRRQQGGTGRTKNSLQNMMKGFNHPEQGQYSRPPSEMEIGRLADSLRPLSPIQKRRPSHFDDRHHTPDSSHTHQLRRARSSPSLSPKAVEQGSQMELSPTLDLSPNEPLRRTRSLPVTQKFEPIVEKSKRLLSIPVLEPIREGRPAMSLGLFPRRITMASAGRHPPPSQQQQQQEQHRSTSRAFPKLGCTDHSSKKNQLLSISKGKKVTPGVRNNEMYFYTDDDRNQRKLLWL